MMLFSITVFAFVIRVQNTLWRQITELTCPFKITHLLSVLPEASLYSKDSSEGLTFLVESVGIYICWREGRGGETHFCPRALLCLGPTFKPLKLLLVSISTILQKFEQLMELGGGGLWEKNEVFLFLCHRFPVRPWSCHWTFCASLTC